MIIWNPLKWDIIGKLRLLIIVFIAVILFGVFAVGIRWVATGSSTQEASFLFKKPLPEDKTKVAQDISAIAIEQKLENFTVNFDKIIVSTEETNERVDLRADNITADQVSKVFAPKLQELYGELKTSNVTIETVSIPGQPFNWGLDFTGGTIFEMTFKNTFSDSKGMPLPDEEIIGKVRQAFAKNGVSVSVVQVQRSAIEDEKLKAENKGKTTIANSILVRTQESSETKLKAVTEELKKYFGEDLPEKQRVDTIGPTVGQELKDSAVKALLIALAMIFIYIAFRFQPRAGVAAVACLIHDLAFVLGVLAVSNVEINSAAVAALLSLITFDVQDTVVIMDRVRENTKLYIGQMPYDRLMNMSVTQTYMRSLNTSVTMAIGILVMIFFGGKEILDFTLIFFFGLIAGSWSSIYIAVPLLVVWKNFESRYVKADKNVKTYQLQTPEGVKVKAVADQKIADSSRPLDMPVKKGPPKKKNYKRKK